MIEAVKMFLIWTTAASGTVLFLVVLMFYPESTDTADIKEN